MKLASKWLICLFLSAPVFAAEQPGWAYPAVPPISASTDPALLSVAGSERHFTQGQVDSGYEVADWFPGEHPPMPRVVAAGGEPPLRACAMCHLPNGAGHPESAGLAGQPEGYLAAQVRAFVSGERAGSRAASMTPIAKAMTEDEIGAAARYFASLKPVRWTRVVEAETAPVTRLGLGAVRYTVENGGTETLGSRIISVPQDDAAAEKRDSHSGFVEFVPPGSIERGRALAERPLGGITCGTCHGTRLHGRGDIPRLAGQLALVLFRGLNDIAIGHRTTAGALAMKAAMPSLNEQEMIALAAYLASLPPE